MQRLEEASQRGVYRGFHQSFQQGIQQSKRLFVESMLQVVYFGDIDEELSRIIDPVLQVEFIDIARQIVQFDRPELQSHFNQKNQPKS